MARIFIVEDDLQIGFLIETIVKKAGHEPVRMFNAVELEHAIDKKDMPDLLLLDIMLGEKNGYEILREWKERLTTRAIPVIIISARSAEHDKVKGLDLGAEDYVTKPFGVRELQARISAALRRIPVQPEKIQIGCIELRPQTRNIFVDGNHVELTAKEFDVLLYLAKHAGITVTRGMLLRDVWGYATEEDPSRTVDSHIKTLRNKMGDAAKMIQTMRGTGYRLSEDA